MTTAALIADVAGKGIAALFVTALAYLAFACGVHTMRSCECCSAPDEDDDEDDVTVGDDPDRWRDYDEADRWGVL